jgi:putative membrane protein
MCWGGGWLMMIVLTILIIAAVVWVIRAIQVNQNGGTSSLQSTETPTDILKKRFAKGEISKEQFEQMKKDLM